MHPSIGKEQRLRGIIDPERAAAMHATLGRVGSPPGVGDPLPAFWHYAWFWDIQPPAGLGRDGHPKIGEFIPDLGLPRRMWAGGTLEWLRPVFVGQQADYVTRIEDVKQKEGRSGPLGLVTLRQELRQGGQLCVSERRDLVYRPDIDPIAPPTPPVAPSSRRDETHSRAMAFDTTLLFRYSALTFNGHRIHYDRDYARGVEGYPGLVVHGPLLAQALIDFAQDLGGALSNFCFRATAPVFDHETAVLCACENHDGLDLWVRVGDWRQAMAGTARF